ncbi:MAG: PAS domain S-box protein [Burkholderiaceae bacterium]|nr:PAS domain S-box protein [Burkholderiaceae bacterium]
MPDLDDQPRLAALHDLAVLDTPPEPVFDAIAALAAQVCEVPIALISLVDVARQWFKANMGLPGVSQTPREVAFCHHAIAQAALLEVPDAQADPRFRDNPLVTGRPDIRFYAGAPIEVAGGHRIGTVCVIDRQPRQLTDVQRTVLAGLARIASLALADRRSSQDAAAALAQSEARYRAIVEDQSELISVADPDGTLRFVNAAYARHFDMTPQRMVGRNLLDFVDDADRAAVAAHLASLRQSGAAAGGINRMRSAAAAARWVSWVNRPLLGAGGAVQAIQSVGRDITEQHQAQEAWRAALAERETLLKEVYHRVKNNLQMVQSLLSLQQRASTNPLAQHALQESARRVRAMALVHEKLYQTSNLRTVSLRDYTADLLRQIDEATGATRQGVALQAAVPDLACQLDGAIPYGLIVTELVTNAMEHAFAGGRAGRLQVTLELQGEVPVLSVFDDGPGLPADFDIDKAPSMGLQLASALAAQLGGRLQARSAQGAQFSAALPRLVAAAPAAVSPPPAA